MTNITQTNIGEADVEVVTVKVVRPYVLDITFSDGTRRQVDVEDQLWGEAFEPLKDPEFFAQAMIDGGTVAWPNGADFAPEFLHGFPGTNSQGKIGGKSNHKIQTLRTRALAEVMDAFMQLVMAYQIHQATFGGEINAIKLAGVFVEGGKALRSLLGESSTIARDAELHDLSKRLVAVLEQSMQEMARI